MAAKLRASDEGDKAFADLQLACWRVVVLVQHYATEMYGDAYRHPAPAIARPAIRGAIQWVDELMDASERSSRMGRLAAWIQRRLGRKRAALEPA